MAHPMGESKQGDLRVDFDRRLKPAFHGSKVTTDTGSLAYRELDDSLFKALEQGRFEIKASQVDKRPKNGKITIIGSVCYDGSRVTGYCRLSWVVGAKCTASAP